jgi:hypothetical protein
MAHPSYGLGVGGFSPLGADDHTIYQSPASYQQPFHSYDPDVHHGDLGGGIEMQHQKLYDSAHDEAYIDDRARMYSTSSTVFPSM